MVRLSSLIHSNFSLYLQANQSRRKRPRLLGPSRRGYNHASALERRNPFRHGQAESTEIQANAVPDLHPTNRTGPQLLTLAAFFATTDVGAWVECHTGDLV